MRSKNTKWHKVQLNFYEEEVEEMDRLQTRIHVNSHADVLRTAVSVLGWLDKHLSCGDKIKVELRESGETMLVEFPFLIT